MAAPHYSRTYRRFPLHVPVIFGGAPCVGEGTLLNLSVMGCSIMTDQAVLCGSDVRVSLLLPGHDSALSIELGKVKWVKGYEFGVEFVRMPLESRQRLNKIFMGDTGSLLLGLVNSILVIKFINSAGTPGYLPIDIVSAAPALGFAILMVPLFDTLRVFGLRILSRRSPFSPDRNHVHHFLLDLGFTHKQITFTCVSANLLFISLALFAKNMGTTAVIALLLTSAISLTFLLYYLRNRSRQASLPMAHSEKAEMITTHKVLGIMAEPVEMD